MHSATVEVAAPTEVHAAPPSTRRGRHRDHALAAWRRSEAIRLKTAGWTYQRIAQELGYANRGTVHRIVSQALEAREVESVDLLRQLELDRLDALQLALWTRAMHGEVPAALAVLRILDQRIRLLGLAEVSRKQQPQDAWPSCQGPATVVIHPDVCRYQGCLRHGRFADSPSQS
jgi:hypothetical protein